MAKGNKTVELTPEQAETARQRAKLFAVRSKKNAERVALKALRFQAHRALKQDTRNVERAARAKIAAKLQEAARG